MSSAFLAVPARVKKLVVLSSRDNLDTTLVPNSKPLTLNLKPETPNPKPETLHFEAQVVGQMQGGFQLEVVQGGHAIHEVHAPFSNPLLFLNVVLRSRPGLYFLGTRRAGFRTPRLRQPKPRHTWVLSHGFVSN